MRAWRNGAAHGATFCRALELDAAFVDLSAPDLPALERDLERVLAATAAQHEHERRTSRRSRSR